MEENKFIIPPHSNRMALSILCTIFCCQIAGIIAIIYSSRSNQMYDSAMVAIDEKTKQNMYLQSESANKTALTWLIIALVFGILTVIGMVIAVIAAGGLEYYL